MEKHIDTLIDEVLLLLNGKDGNIRVGSAEITGKITPPSILKKVINEL